MDRRPDPLLPDFSGANLTQVVPALMAQLAGAPANAAPDWLPTALAGATQLVLLVVDGLGWDQLQARRGLAPTLASGTGGPITSVAPSTTAAALTSLTTGLPPAVHGLLGYRVHLDGDVMNLLTWRRGKADVRQTRPPGRLQPHRAFPGAPAPVPVVTRAEFGATGFSAAHLAGTVQHGWYTGSGLVVETAALLAAGAPFVYAYFDGIDRTAHARGLGPHFDAELRTVDRLVGDLLDVLPPTAALVVTADHGQVEVGPSTEVLGGDLMGAVHLLSGEGRFRWLHVAPGAADDVAEAAQELHGDVAWVRTRAQLIDQGWLGGEPVPDVADRLGDVALVPFTDTAFMDPADTGELRLVGRHGSLTPAEMLVPLLGWASPAR